MGDNPGCVARGLEALRLLGVDIPPGILENPEIVPTYEDGLVKAIEGMTAKRGLTETFSSLPVLKDETVLAAHKVLIEIIASLSFAAPHLLHTIPLIGCNLVLKYGTSSQTAFHVCLWELRLIADGNACLRLLEF
jgi:hypothetical protein